MFHGHSNEHSVGFVGKAWKVIFRPPKLIDFVPRQSGERRREQRGGKKV